MQWFLGTMGFAYQQWVGVFYPEGMAQKYFLTHYSGRFNSVEMDTTFYGTPRANTVLRWAESVPDGFKFCPKMPKIITHDTGLHGEYARALTAEFLDVMSLLNGKLGPILIQLPPMFGYEQVDTLADYLEELPPTCRYAVEFRHRSWYRKETAVLLQKHNICWAAADYIYLPKKVIRTTDFLYLRFIGPHGQFPTKNQERIDKTEDLHRWKRQVQPHFEAIHAIYGYFNNDYAGYSPATCNRFKAIVGQEPADIRVYQQGRLF
jgi:uncharacterized protein YecE (DUF72 family)